MIQNNLLQVDSIQGSLATINISTHIQRYASDRRMFGRQIYPTSYPTSKHLYYPTSKRLYHLKQTYINIYKCLLLQGLTFSQYFVNLKMITIHVSAAFILYFKYEKWNKSTTLIVYFKFCYTYSRMFKYLHVLPLGKSFMTFSHQMSQLIHDEIWQQFMTFG